LRFDLFEGEKLVKSIENRRMRLGCRCAVCVDEMTNELLIKEDQIPLDVHPTH